MHSFHAAVGLGGITSLVGKIGSFKGMRGLKELNICGTKIVGAIDQATFGMLLKTATLKAESTDFEFAAWVIGKYKES